jgi:hypothetical protein
LQRIQRICADCGKFLLEIGLILSLLVTLLGCQPSSDSAIAPPPGAPAATSCGEDGYLSTELFGALDSKIEWNAADLECEGMPRPDGDGARLRFAGSIGGDRNIAFIVALPDLRRGETGKEYQSKVTLIEEGNSRFFSTADNDICWTDIVELENVADSAAKFAISGTLYCVAPLTEINGASDISIRDLKFRGLLDWDAS